MKCTLSLVSIFAVLSLSALGCASTKGNDASEQDLTVGQSFRLYGSKDHEVNFECNQYTQMTLGYSNIGNSVTFSSRVEGMGCTGPIDSRSDTFSVWSKPKDSCGSIESVGEEIGYYLMNPRSIKIVDNRLRTCDNSRAPIEVIIGSGRGLEEVRLYSFVPGPNAKHDCDVAASLCYGSPPSCPNGQVRTVNIIQSDTDRSCYGECVTPDRCGAKTLDCGGTATCGNPSAPACRSGERKLVRDNCSAECVPAAVCKE
jgi:hypothetical protein